MLCPYCQSPRTTKKGFYENIGRNRRQRHYCRMCLRYFSETATHLLSRQKRPDLNRLIFALLVSGMSQRKIAMNLSTTRKTVDRKLLFLARHARSFHAAYLTKMEKISDATFDEMETFEHSKCKPVAIVVAVNSKTRKIIAARVAKMPAKGRLAAISRRRYGRRPDLRPRALRAVLSAIKSVSTPDSILRSDQSPRYPRYVREILPDAIHKSYKGRRAVIAGLGELKVGGFDPLFSLNHTCAMLRDNIKRLSRRTWCTTKRPDRLQCLVDLYVVAHNFLIDASSASAQQRRLLANPWLLVGAGADMEAS